jgi:hypothetical protein
MCPFGVGLLVALFINPPAGSPPTGQSYAVHVGSWPQKITREVCAQKAMAAMARQSFLCAGVDADGNAWGFTATTAVMVVSFRYLDGVQVVLVAAGRDNGDAERLRNLLRSEISDAPLDADSPSRIGDPDTKRGPDVPYLCCHLEQRSLINLLRFFDTASCILLEKHGLNTNIHSKCLVFAGMQDMVVTTFLGGGPNGVSANLGVVTASPSAGTAQEFSRTLCRELVKLLYE